MPTPNDSAQTNDPEKLRAKVAELEAALVAKGKEFSDLEAMFEEQAATLKANLTPLAAGIEAELRGEISALKTAYSNKEKECAGIKVTLDETTAALRASADKKAAAKVVKGAFAKVPVLGEGRRLIAVGESLNSDECDGLTEGVHFELRG